MLYFFNVAGAICDPDQEGVELETIGDARHTAVLFASEMMRDNPAAIWAGEEFRVEVTNPDQLHLFTVIMSGVDAPVMLPGSVRLPVERDLL